MPDFYMYSMYIVRTLHVQLSVQQTHKFQLQFLYNTHRMLQAVLQVGDDFVCKAVSPHLTTELCVQAV